MIDDRCNNAQHHTKRITITMIVLLILGTLMLLASHWYAMRGGITYQMQLDSRPLTIALVLMCTGITALIAAAVMF